MLQSIWLKLIFHWQYFISLGSKIDLTDESGCRFENDVFLSFMQVQLITWIRTLRTSILLKWANMFNMEAN